MLKEIDQRIAKTKETYDDSLVSLARDVEQAKAKVYSSIEKAVAQTSDPFAKLSLSDYKQQLDSAFVSMDFATDRFKAQEEVYLSALEGGTKYFSPSAQTEYAKLDLFNHNEDGTAKLQPGLAVD